MKAPRLFCFGLGYSAQVLARRLQAQGWQIAGTVRSVQKAEALAQQGIESFVFDEDQALSPTAIAWLCGADAMLSSLPGNDAGDAALSAVTALLAQDPRCLERLRWAGYLSTTVVYGDWQGARVDEASPTKATTARGLRRLAFEQAWSGLGLPMHIFRLAGIYGPGRSALNSLRAGKARRLDKPGQVFSRIHVEDIAGVLAASLAKPAAAPGQVEIYNVCDSFSCPPGEVIEYAAQLLDMSPPPLIPFDDADLSPMARSFYADNKRVDSSKLARALGYSLQFPTYREGLDHEWRALKEKIQAQA